MLFDISKAHIEVLNDDLFTHKQVSVSVLRLDKIHPVVSGNKLFKLHYFLDEAVASAHRTILTFGGPWSNHLAATAFACHTIGLKSIGIVRGEAPASLSFTLQQCMTYGMQLKFISRQAYDLKEDPLFTNALKKEFGECCIVPEGGYHPSGASGAALIMELAGNKKYSHTCTAVGTATTLAGLLTAAAPGQTIVAVPVLKNMTDTNERIRYLAGITKGNLQVLNDYHFGGYAKKNSELIQFMNECWIKYRLPLDFVYTAKMLYGVKDSIKHDCFPKGSDILCLHTGGLQGNRSLPLKTLLF
ncbi:MAG TPA: pyridoxal-phosphate dependent enzyme [Ferruginibacter sp.]|nr:pyridoxal-phosphate dependent enzyme [Ferruginibacter sp.]